jgi:hypothetical protein
MKNQSIEVIVSPMGDISIEAVGFKGGACEKATRFLEEALGVCKTRQRKPEYHQNVVPHSSQRIGS